MNKVSNTQKSTCPKPVFPLPVNGEIRLEGYSRKLPQAAVEAILAIGQETLVDENIEKLKGAWKHLHSPLPGQDELCSIFELECRNSHNDAMAKAKSLHHTIMSWKQDVAP